VPSEATGNQYLDCFGGSSPVLSSRAQTLFRTSGFERSGEPACPPPLDIATEWMGGAQTIYQKKRGVEVWLD
jgi:hypothetical protein